MWKQVDKISPFFCSENDQNSPLIFEHNYYEFFLKHKYDKILSSCFNYKDAEIKAQKDINNFKNLLEEISISNKENSGMNKLLVFGSIQSGKTDFIIASIIKDIQEHKSSKNLYIVLTSSDKKLRDQTIDRIDENINKLLGIPDVKINDFKSLKNNDDKENCFNNNIVILMKNKNHLEQINKHIESNINNYSRIMIFDDEGDSASFNDYKKEEKGEKQAINNGITSIFKKIESNKLTGSYYSITATPFAHLLLKNENDIKPEKAFNLMPNYGYLGVDCISDWYNDQHSNNLHIIENNQENWDINQKDFSFEISLINAIYSYLFQCYYYFLNYNSFKNKKPRMLINIFRKKDDQNEIKSCVNKIINGFRNNNNDTRFIKIVKTFIKKIDDNDCLKIKDYIVNNVINKIYLIPHHGKSNHSFDNDEINNYQIIIGHNKVSRGITFKNLSCMYLATTPKRFKMDTLLQQARWLGYRDNNDIMRIYLTDEIKKNYIQISNVINSYREMIETSKNNNESFYNSSRFIETNSKNLEATRNSIAKLIYQDSNIKHSYLSNFKCNSELDKISNEIKDKLFNLFKTKPENTHIIHNYLCAKFKNISEFNSFIFPKLNQMKSGQNEYILENYNILFNNKNNDVVNSNIIKTILEDNSKNVIVRYIFDINNKDNISFDDIENDNYIYKERKTENEISFGSGNYANDFSLYNDEKYKNTILIDLIPINVWSVKWNEENNKKIFRLKLFIPKELIVKNGYVAID